MPHSRRSCQSFIPPSLLINRYQEGSGGLDFQFSRSRQCDLCHSLHPESNATTSQKSIRFCCMRVRKKMFTNAKPTMVGYQATLGLVFHDWGRKSWFDVLLLTLAPSDNRRRCRQSDEKECNDGATILPAELPSSGE